MSSFARDLQYAARSFLRTPRFTIPALLALALGIGATSAVFSVLRGVLLEPLPYSDPDRIVVVWENNLRRNRPRNVISAANFFEWKSRNRSFDRLAMVGPARVNVTTGGEEPEEVTGVFASSDLFPALGVQPSLGRAYGGAEDERGRDRVIVLSHEYWRSRFNGRTDVLGTPMVTNGVPRTVIGVMPPGFTVIGQKANFLIPYGWTIEQLRNAPGRGSSHGVARLREGVSFEQADAEMKGIAAQLEKEQPRNAGWSVTLVPVHEQLVDQIRPALLVLMGAVLMVLLIACVNVANLLLARSAVRQRELGLRTALGAERWRLVRQLLTENLLLSLAAGVLGLALAVAFHRGLLALVADRIPVPRLDQVRIDSLVLGFTLLVSLATSLVFGIAPALTASSGLQEALREGGRHSGGPRARRVLSSLVVAEVALSLVLLTGAGLLIRSFGRLQQIDPGFRADHLLTARVQLPGTRYRESAQIGDFFTRAIERVSALPGVRSASAISFLPLAGLGIATSFYVDGQPQPAPGESPTTEVRPVAPGFFRTMGIPMLVGRDLGAQDRGDVASVGVINETMARRHFPGENPIGRRLRISLGGSPNVEIVGIVGDVKLTTLEGDVRPTVYVPHTQLTIGFMTLVVRTEQEPLSVASAVGATVRSLDPELPVADVQTMDQVLSDSIARARITATLLTVFALMALTLAAVGVYGVMAYSVGQRTQEIGVRMALGATPGAVFRLVLGQAMRLVVGGIVAGVIAAAVLTRSLGTLLYRTEPLDPWTFAATGIILTFVATLACYVPARRGTRIAPVDALRAD
jgi:putative ABC transport system permease protein